MTGQHSSLILVSTDLMSGVARLRKILKELAVRTEIISLSSVYKIFHHRSQSVSSDLIVVLRCLSSLGMEESFAFLQELENTKLQKPGSQDETLMLLAFDQEIRLLPGQNLPNPRLHTDPLALRCAAEAWGDYRHPVLGQKLNELVSSNGSMNFVEFFAQGRSLLSPETT